MDIPSILTMLDHQKEELDCLADELRSMSVQSESNRSVRSTTRSVIKINGKPIAPVVMTERKREEMRQIKEMAIMTETRLKNSKRRRLLVKVQSILNGVQTKTDRTDTKITESDVLGDPEAAKPVGNSGEVGSSYGSSSSDSVAGLNRTVIQQDLSSLRRSIQQKTKKLSTPQTSVECLSPDVLEVTDEANQTLHVCTDSNHVHVENSTLEDSDVSNEEPLHKEDLTIASDSKEFQTETSPISCVSDTVSNAECASQSIAAASLLDSEGCSFIGEYQSFPIIEHSARKPIGISENPENSLENPEVYMQAYNAALFSYRKDNIVVNPLVSSPFTTSSHAQGQRSSAGQIPHSNTTPLNQYQGSSESYIVTGSTDLYQYMQGSMNTTNSSVTLKDEVAPSGGHSRMTTPLCQPSQSTTQHQLPQLKANTTQMFPRIDSKTPPVVEPAITLPKSLTPHHKRSNSYTLEEPSPALLAAHGLSSPNEVLPPSCSQDVSPASQTQSVQRRLNYEEGNGKDLTPKDSLEQVDCLLGKGDVKNAERRGKRQHLQRYLSQISQQPGMVTMDTAYQQYGTVTMDTACQQYGSHTGTMSLEVEDPSITPYDLLQQQMSNFGAMKDQLIKLQKQQLEDLMRQQQQEQLQLKQELMKIHIAVQPTTARQPITAGHQILKTDRQPTTAGHQILNTARQPIIAAHQKSSSDRSPGSGAPSSRKSTSSLNMEMTKNYPIYTGHQKSKLTHQVYPEELLKKFDKISAVVKGYLVRCLLKSDRVQEIIKTIRDTTDFAISFQDETPIKKGQYSMQDKNLRDRVIAQLRAALLEIHDIFFEVSISEKMSIIANSRRLEQEQADKTKGKGMSHQLSAATRKVLERKRQSVSALENRPKTASLSTSSPKQTLSGNTKHQRALRPLQGHISPIKPALVNRSRPRTAPGQDNLDQKHNTKANEALKAKLNIKTVRRSLYKSAVGTKAKVSPRSPLKAKQRTISRNIWK